MRPDYVLVAPSAGRKPQCGWLSIGETCFGDRPTASDRPYRPLVHPRPTAGFGAAWAFADPGSDRLCRRSARLSFGARSSIEQLSALTAVCLRSHVPPNGSRPTRKQAAVTTTPECDRMHIPTMHLGRQYTYRLARSKAIHIRIVLSPGQTHPYERDAKGTTDCGPTEVLEWSQWTTDSLSDSTAGDSWAPPSRWVAPSRLAPTCQQGPGPYGLGGQNSDATPGSRASDSRLWYELSTVGLVNPGKAGRS